MGFYISLKDSFFAEYVGMLWAGRGHGRSLVVGRDIDSHPAGADAKAKAATDKSVAPFNAALAKLGY